MHIAIVTPKFVRGDGQGRVNVEIAHCLLERGHHLSLLAQEAMPSLIAHPGVTWVPLPGGSWPTALLREAALAWTSDRWLRAHRSSVDLVVSNGCATSVPADLNAAHFVHHAWRIAPANDSSPSSGLRRWYQALYTTLNVRWERRALTSARRVVAVSDQVRDELILAGVAPHRIQVIPNGVDLAEFSPGPVDRHALGLPVGVPLALFVGDLQTPRKNLDTTLRALQHTPSLHLAVVGRVAGSPYTALAEELGLASRVHFLDFRTDVPDLMRAADFVVCPSRYEPFSLVVLEALASGRPVITSRRVGAAALLTADCGIVVDDPDAVDVLAGALLRLTENPGLCEQMGRAGRTLAQHYAWTGMAAQYASLLDELAPPAPVASSPALD
jgi:glycosyltransferase involved in cell wall biosynthesis